VASAEIAVRGERGPGLGEILALVEPDLLRVEAMLEEHLRSDVGLVNEIARYVRSGGGKRVPARVTAALSAAVRPRQRTSRALRHGRGAAAHGHGCCTTTSSTVQSCAVDKKTVSQRWAANVSVLLGDFMFAKSFEMGTDTRDVAHRAALDRSRSAHDRRRDDRGRASNELGPVTEAENLDLIRRKTADLFSACARIGAALGNVSDAKARALAAYGLNLGICFQMVDDLLDFTGSEARLGKAGCQRSARGPCDAADHPPAAPRRCGHPAAGEDRARGSEL